MMWKLEGGINLDEGNISEMISNKSNNCKIDYLHYYDKGKIELKKLEIELILLMRTLMMQTSEKTR